MTRRPFRPTRLATTVQVASLLVVAVGLFAIVISNINYNKGSRTTGELLAEDRLDLAPGTSLQARR